MRSELSRAGETLQLTALVTLPSGERADRTVPEAGTTWGSSNAGIASVSDDGRVTAHRRGSVLIMALNEGVFGSRRFEILIPNDADGDGLSDEFELALGLNPNDPGDAALDGDSDGLTNAEEFELGTDIGRADTDGDGVSDGAEVAAGTDPLSPDSDGDGLLDGEEARLGTDPLLADTDGDGVSDGVEVGLRRDPLVAESTTTVVGQVVDATGAVVEGAAATVLAGLTATTDADGRFGLEGVPADRDLTVEVSLVREGQVSDGASAPVSPVPDGVTDVGVIALSDVDGVVTGTVRSPRGEPVPDVRLTVSAAGEPPLVVRSDASGRYRADELSPGGITVQALDPVTGLRGFAAGSLLAGEALSLDVGLDASGLALGAVLARDGETPVSSGVDVTLLRNLDIERDNVTDPLGEFLFDFVPLGFYTIEAEDNSGNRGRTSVALTATNQAAVADFPFLGRGRVEGVVLSGAGVPVADATVVVESRSIFGGSHSATTDAAGAFFVDGVFVGDVSVSASDPTRRLAGSVASRIEHDGEVASVTVTLEPGATLTGTVFEVDGVTPAPDVRVGLEPTRRSVLTGPDGRFVHDALPLDTYQILASRDADGDRGKAIAVLDAPDATVAQDVVLTGTGTVLATVVDHDGVRTVPGVQVRVEPADGAPREAVTDASGRAVLDDVLAGSFSVQALDPVEGLGGEAESEVAPGAIAEITVRLQAAGTVLGTVLAPDASTPAPNVRVTLAGREAATAADGRFRFDMVPIVGSPLTLRAFEGNGTLRGEVTGIALAGNGDEVLVDVVLDGTGSVAGRVVDSNGLPIPAASLVLDSGVLGAPDRFARADDDGSFRIDGIPVGEFTLFASGSSIFAEGFVQGALSTDGEFVEVEITLLAGQVGIPRPPEEGDGDPVSPLSRRIDGNNGDYTVQTDGSIRDGTNRVFRGGGIRRGASVLFVGEERFLANGGRFEDDGAEIVLTAGSATGLEVTRKVFVPATGYFARYLEVLTNPTPDPVTVDIRLDTHFAFFGFATPGFRPRATPMSVIATASGDTILQPGVDSWVAVDDAFDADPDDGNRPPVVQVSGGALGTLAPDGLEYTVDDESTFTRLGTEWRSFSVEPGETRVLMHFLVQQIDRAGARAAGDRLLRLPEEALAGMAAEECAAVSNFDVPPDCSSAVPPILVDGTVTGTVFEGDAGTPVADARVRFESDEPIFGRTRTVRTDEAGAFEIGSRTGGIDGGTALVPRAGFTVRATHPRSGVRSADLRGQFDGMPEARADIVLETGLLSGTVRRFDGTVASAGSVRLSGEELLDPLTVTLGTDGHFAFDGLPAGTYTLVATVPVDSKFSLAGTVSAAVAVGGETVVEIGLEPTGTVAGTVVSGVGTPAVGTQVTLTLGDVTRSAVTDTGGRFTFVDVPLGTFELAALDPGTRVTSRSEVEVLAGITSEQELELLPAGRIELTATFEDGSPVPDGLVVIRRLPAGNLFRGAGRTNALGQRTIFDVPVGEFTVRVFNPDTRQLAGEFTGTVSSQGEVVAVAVEVPVDRPPSLEITEPNDGAEVVEGVSVPFRVAAADDLGIDRVSFFVDGVLVASDRDAPFEHTLIAPDVDGAASLSLTATVRDTSGQEVDAPPVILRVVDDLAPSIALTAPVAGTGLVEGREIAVRASAADDIAVQRVTFTAGGDPFAVDEAAPFETVFAIPSDFVLGDSAPLTLSAIAVDSRGQESVAEATFTVAADDPPLIELTQAPAPGAVFPSGATIELRADASDDFGVTAVRLLVDGAVQTTLASPPFEFEVQLPAVASGEAVLTDIRVEATDTLGQVASTPPLGVEVRGEQQQQGLFSLDRTLDNPLATGPPPGIEFPFLFGQGFGSQAVVHGGRVLASSRPDLFLPAFVVLLDARTSALVAPLSGLQDDPGPVDPTTRTGVSLALSDRLAVVGLPDDSLLGDRAGRVALYDAETGDLLTTFISPAPAPGDRFGASVALGDGIVLVGAPGDDAAGADAGAVYAFEVSTGALLRIFEAQDSNPVGDRFGASVAAVDTRVLVGAPGNDARGEDVGRGYLFDVATGALELVVDDPTPVAAVPGGSAFGTQVALDGHRVLVSVADAAGQGTGEVHLFDADSGGLLQTYSDPGAGDATGFGRRIGLAGPNVLVGAPGDATDGSGSGRAYLFDAVTGALRQTFTDPTASALDAFGTSVSVHGDTVVLGAPGDDTFRPDAGQVHVYRADPAHDAVLLADGFDDESLGTERTVLSRWMVVQGAVDVVDGRAVGGGLGPARADPYLDLDGSGAAAGVARLESTVSPELLPGRYRLSLELGSAGDFGAGSEPGVVVPAADNEIAVSLVGLLEERVVVPAGRDFRSVDFDFFVDEVTVAGVAIEALGSADGLGPLIDNVRLERIPEPATLNAPFPVAGGEFGFAVSLEGTDVLVGASAAPIDGQPAAGEVYLLDARTGRMKRRLESPGVAPEDRFGAAVALDAGRALVGEPGDDTVASDAGQAHLLGATTGERLLTFDNPALGSSDVPGEGDAFGFAVALAGDRAVVGAPLTDTGEVDAGQVHLFSATTGVRIRSLSAPVADETQWFGAAVATDGERVLVGAPLASDPSDPTLRRGAAFLFDAGSGTLLRTFRDPTPSAPSADPGGLDVADRFGSAVALDGDRALVGARADSTNGAHVGQAHLFDTATGAVIGAFDDPGPTPDGSLEGGDQFGAALDLDGAGVLVGADSDDTAGARVGQAHVFDIATGELLATFDDPTPTEADGFGFSGAIERNRVVVGAPFDDSAGTDAGQAHVLVVGAEALAVRAPIIAGVDPASVEQGRVVTLTVTGERLDAINRIAIDGTLAVASDAGGSATQRQVQVAVASGAVIGTRTLTLGNGAGSARIAITIVASTGGFTDSDSDGIGDADELVIGTDPAKVDSDGDGFADSTEVEDGSDPTRAASLPPTLLRSFLGGAVSVRNDTAPFRDENGVRAVIGATAGIRNDGAGFRNLNGLRTVFAVPLSARNTVAAGRAIGELTLPAATMRNDAPPDLATGRVVSEPGLIQNGF